MLHRVMLVWCLASALAGCQSAPTNPPTAREEGVSSRAPVKTAPPEPVVPCPPQRHVLFVGPAPAQPAPRQPAPSQMAPIYPLARRTAVLPHPRSMPSAPQTSYALPPGYTTHSTLRPPSQGSLGPSAAQQMMAEQQQRIQANNAAIIEQTLNRYQPQYPQLSVPQVNYPQAPCPQATYPRSNPREQAERRYLEARADFMNTKYLPAGSPPRWTADSVRGEVGTGMPLPPDLMRRDATFNPVMQKAQQAEVLRQEMSRIPNTGFP